MVQNKLWSSYPEKTTQQSCKTLPLFLFILLFTRFYGFSPDFLHQRYLHLTKTARQLWGSASKFPQAIGGVEYTWYDASGRFLEAENHQTCGVSSKSTANKWDSCFEQVRRVGSSIWHEKVWLGNSWPWQKWRGPKSAKNAWSFKKPMRV